MSENLMEKNYHCNNVVLNWIFGIGVLLQLTSVVILTTINNQATAEAEFRLDLFNFHPLKLGTAEDFDAMVQILAAFSTSYNWLTTGCMLIIILALIN